MSDAKSRLVAAWRAKAEEDMAVARLLITQERRLYAAAVYHCQQAAEKMLKAWLTHRGVGFPKTHDLELLLHLCHQSGAQFVNLEQAVRELTPLATEFRYPGDADAPLPEDAGRALQLAENVFAEVGTRW